MKIIVQILILFYPFLLFSQNIIWVKEGDKSKLISGRADIFKDNLPDGHYISYRNNDTLNRGGEVYFKNKKKDGLESRYFSDGVTKYLEINWKEDRRNGITTGYGGNCGIKCISYQVSFRNDTLSGPYFVNNPCCAKSYSGYFKNGFRDSLWTYYESDNELIDSSNYWPSKVYRYTDGLPLLITAWNKKGVQTVKNGEGKIIDSSSSLTETNYINGLKNGIQIETKPNGTVENWRFYKNGELVIEKKFVDLNFDTSTYVEVKHFNFRYPAHTYLYSISEWQFPDGTLRDTFPYWIDTYITDLYYNKVTIRNEEIPNGYWAEFYPNGIKSFDGNYTNGKRTGKWEWNYMNGNVRLRVNYTNNEYHHYDSLGNFYSNLPKEYISLLVGNPWYGDLIGKKESQKMVFYLNSKHFKEYSISFYYDGRIELWAPFGRGHVLFGHYYLLGDRITLITFDRKKNTIKKSTYKISSKKDNALKLKRVK